MKQVSRNEAKKLVNSGWSIVDTMLCRGWLYGVLSNGFRTVRYKSVPSYKA